MPVHEQFPSVTQLQVVVDAVLVPRGFAPAQSGISDLRGQIIWCAAAHDLAAWFPRLLANQEPAGGWGTRCIDIVVDLADADGHDDWRVTGVDVEGDDLDRLLSELELVDAAGRATAMLGSPVEDCCTLLPSLLVILLEEAAAGASRKPPR